MEVHISHSSHEGVAISIVAKYGASLGLTRTEGIRTAQKALEVGLPEHNYAILLTRFKDSL